MDNATNCDVLARVLGILLMERYGMHFHSDNARIRCLAHVVNIVVQTLLKQLNEAEDPSILDWFDANKHLPVHYNGDEDEDVRAMEAEELLDSEDGSTKVDEVLKDELPEDAVSLSVVKKVFFWFIHSVCRAHKFYLSSESLSTKLSHPRNAVSVSNGARKSITAEF